MNLAFTGHRPTKIGGYNPDNPIRTAVRQEIKKVLSENKEKYGHNLLSITGGALGIDQDAALISKELGIDYIVAVPCIGQEQTWPESSKKLYRQILSDAVHVIYVTRKLYSPALMQLRNEWMVDKCDALVAVWDESSGGTANCVAYAVKQAKPIIRINPREILGKKSYGIQ